MVGKVIPRPAAALHPSLIRQVVNPFKQLARIKASRDFSMYVDALRMASFPNSAPSWSVQRQSRCTGYFWDSVNKRNVVVDLGYVICRLVFSYRAASSLSTALDSELDNILSREEGAAPYEDFSASEYRAELSEHGTQHGEKSTGPYVIPVQSPTDWTNHQNCTSSTAQKTGGQILTDWTKPKTITFSGVDFLLEGDFPWSLEKCMAEIC